MVVRSGIVYPSSDGKRMAENQRQGEWIQRFVNGFSHIYGADHNVFLAWDLLWYPAEGEPQICLAPDCMIAFGRPRFPRRDSYRQWEEDNIAPHVVVEIRSPSNSDAEMIAKHQFYEDHGVEEYYDYDPDTNLLFVYLRSGNENMLRRVYFSRTFMSPLTGARFEISSEGLEVFAPDGYPFLNHEEVDEENRRQQAQIESAIERADAEAKKAKREKDRADAEAKRAKGEQDRADAEAKRAKEAEQKLADLMAKLRAAGIDPETTVG